MQRRIVDGAVGGHEREGAAGSEREDAADPRGEVAEADQQQGSERHEDGRAAKRVERKRDHRGERCQRQDAHARRGSRAGRAWTRCGHQCDDDEDAETGERRVAIALGDRVEEGRVLAKAEGVRDLALGAGVGETSQRVRPQQGTERQRGRGPGRAHHASPRTGALVVGAGEPRALHQRGPERHGARHRRHHVQPVRPREHHRQRAQAREPHGARAAGHAFCAVHDVHEQGGDPREQRDAHELTARRRTKRQRAHHAGRHQSGVPRARAPQRVERREAHEAEEACAHDDEAPLAAGDPGEPEQLRQRDVGPGVLAAVRAEERRGRLAASPCGAVGEPPDAVGGVPPGVGVGDLRARGDRRAREHGDHRGEPDASIHAAAISDAPIDTDDDAEDVGLSKRALVDEDRLHAGVGGLEANAIALGKEALHRGLPLDHGDDDLA